MAKNKKDEVKIFSGSRPYPGSSTGDTAYSSADGSKVYIQFIDPDSTGLFPSSGLQSRFQVTRITGGTAVTVNPASTFIDSVTPKLLQLNLNTSDKIVDATYDINGNIVNYQDVKVTYLSTAGLGVSLSDNDATKSFVEGFVGLGVSNRTEEANPPVPLAAYSSTDGLSISLVFREASPPIFPYTNLSGFAITQGTTSYAISSSSVVDPTSASLGKIVKFNLNSKLDLSDGTNPITISYVQPSNAALKIKDSTILGNYLASFGGFSVTNNVAETNPPLVIDSYTSTGSPQYVYVLMSEPTLPGSSAIGFSVYKNNLLSSISGISALNDTYGGVGVTLYRISLSNSFLDYDKLEIDYKKQSSNYVTDQSANLNLLNDFTQKRLVTNLFDGTSFTNNGSGIINVFSATESYVDTNGTDIYLYFIFNRTEQTLPADDIQGFKLYVNDQPYPVTSAISLPANDEAHVKLTTNARIRKDSVVKIAYVKGNFKKDSSTDVASFEPQSITNNSFFEAVKYFDLYEWNDNTNSDISYTFDIDNESNDLFRKSEIYPSANVILDTQPPKGLAIINRGSSSNTGIQVHKFDAFGAVTEETGTSTDFSIDSTSVIWSFSLSSAQEITSFTFKLKRDLTILNTGDRINFSVYSHDDVTNNPSAALFTIGSVYFGDLTASYQDFNLSLSTSQSLLKDTTYWVVGVLDNLPVGVSTNPVIKIPKHTKTNSFLGYSTTDFTDAYSLYENTSPYYKITSSNISESPLASTDLVLDIFERPIREAEYFGSDSSLQKYELFGDKNSNFITKKLTKSFEDLNDPANDIYPVVSKVIIGATASKPKNYMLEIKTSVNGMFKKVFDTVVDSSTTDYLVYTFDTPLSVVEMRLVYKGDYFTVDQQGSLTLIASDDFSEVVQAQISHYSDFRDAKNFQDASAVGYVGFEEGKTEFQNWDITSLSQAFLKKTGNTSSDITSSVNFNNNLILGSNNKVFYFNSEVLSSSNDQIVDSKYQITCMAVFKGKVYLGTNNGYIYSSYSGDFWTIVNSIDPLDRPNYKTTKPINCMTVFGDKLYIGTSKGTSTVSSVYSYDGFTLELVKSFSDYENVSSMSAYKSNLFIGLGNAYGSSSSSIYKFDGEDWTQTLSSEFDNVEAISASTARTSIVAGFRGGEIWELPFTNSLPTSWRKIQTIDSDRIYSISDDTSGKYLFISTDQKTSLYIKSIDSFKTVTKFDKTISGLNKTWWKYPSYALSYSSDLTDKENFTYKNLSIQSVDINSNDFSLSGFGSSSRLLIKGSVKASKDGVYSFKTVSNMGLNLLLAGTSVTSNFGSTTLSADQTLISNRTFTLNQNDLVDLEIEAFVSNSTTPSLKLFWNNMSTTNGYEIIPNEQFVRSNEIKNIIYSNSLYYGVGSDGGVYEFDPTVYESKVRNVYVRFKDEAGNIQGISVDANGDTYEILTDKISQELYESNGKIYQIKKNDDSSLSTRVIYTPNARDYAIFAPDRTIRASGIYESQPFFVPTLVKWNYLTTLVTNKYALNTLNGNTIEGLDAGTSVQIYVRTGNSRTECLSSTWQLVAQESYINNDSTIPPFSSLSGDIRSFNGRWMQYKFELNSATKNLSPEVISTTLTYTAGTASYFFTKVFDTSDYDSTAPMIKRGLLTSNELLNDGTITYGYITSENQADIYDFNKYTPVSLNQSFELLTPSSTIKFGILFTSVGVNPSMVYDFAVQLDLGNDNIKFMPTL